MSHVAIAIFLGLVMVFDFVFLFQFYERESMRYELKSYKNGSYNREGRCSYMLIVFFEGLFEVAMTQVGLFSLYTDVCFVVLMKSAGLTSLFTGSLISLILIIIPKLYSLVLTVLLLFGCISTEDRRRKYAYRTLTFDEFRI